jgi:hypothetical protein
MKRVSVSSCLAAEIQSKLHDTFISHTKNHKPSYLSKIFFNYFWELHSVDGPLWSVKVNAGSRIKPCHSALARLT